MKSLFHISLLTLATLVVVSEANAQVPSGSYIAPGNSPGANYPGTAANGNGASDPMGNSGSPRAPAALGAPLGAQYQSLPAQQSNTLAELAKLQQNMDQLSALKRTTQEAGQKDEKLQKQVELLQKQIEVQQKMIQLLLERTKEQPLEGSTVEKLQTQVLTLEARSKQAAQRDQELANAVDNIVEHQDAVERDWSSLPAGLKSLFLPSGNNETPLSIYGALAFGYSRFVGDSTTAANGAGRSPTPGGFYFGEFTPDFLLKLNDWIFLEAEIGIGGNGSVAAGSFAQADFFINDWLTIIAGRFVAPIGWFNERLNNPWINLLPGDAPGSGPLLWQQVLPTLSLLGVEAQGAFYLGKSPLKMEYAAYISNGMNLPAGVSSPDDLANLENMTTTFGPTITNDHLLGGRIGLWWPEMGLEGGISGLINGDYVAGGFEDSISLWAVDLNYKKGDWDVRLEYGATYQQAGDFAASNIRRQGFSGQVAYRPFSLPNGFLQRTELVYRYGYVDFKGIDPTMLTLSSYSTPVDVPVRRQQNEFGIDYWFSPRMVLKFAYQINDEPGFHLHDNQFITELSWGW